MVKPQPPKLKLRVQFPSSSLVFMKKLNFLFKNKLKIKKHTNKAFNKKPTYLFSEKFVSNSSNFKSNKNFDWFVNLIIPAGEASSMPPVGPLLGQHGFNTQTFYNVFNTQTSIYPKGLPLWTCIKLFSDKSILFWIRLPSVSFLVYSVLNIKKNDYLNLLDIFKILLLKKIDFPFLSLTSLLSNILGTCHSMDLKVYLKS